MDPASSQRLMEVDGERRLLMLLIVLLRVDVRGEKMPGDVSPLNLLSSHAHCTMSKCFLGRAIFYVTGVYAESFVLRALRLRDT